MFKKSQSGRSLLEMIAVLAIVAILILGAIFLFNTLLTQYRQKNTVKQMDTLVTRYRSGRLMRRKNGQIVLKDLMPEASSDELKTTDGGSIFLDDSGENSFVVISTNLNEFSCRDIVEEGNYDAVSYGDTKDVSDATLITNSADEAKLSDTLKIICAAQYQYFLFSKDKAANLGCKYYIKGKCSDCPHEDEVMGMDDTCCTQETLDKNCGYCKKECGGKTVEFKGAQVLLKCVGGVCVGPDGKECDHVGQKDGCEAKGANCWCNSSHQCECCEDCQFFNGNTCVAKSDKPALGKECNPVCGCAEGTCISNICVQDPDCALDPDNVAKGKVCKTGGVCGCCSPQIEDENGFCYTPSHPDTVCSDIPEYQSTGRLCLNKKSECDCCDGQKWYESASQCCSPANWDDVTKTCACPNCKAEPYLSQRKTVKNGCGCQCQTGYEWDDSTGKCEPKCPEGSTPHKKGDSCSSDICPCPSTALVCEGTCQCDRLPVLKDEECWGTCGCGNAFICSVTGEQAGLCTCPSDSKLPKKDEKCNEDCGCYTKTGLICEDNKCVCPPPQPVGEVCYEGCGPCEGGVPCTDGVCCPPPNGTSCVADRYYARYPGKCIEKTKINCADSTREGYDPNKTVCNTDTEQCVQCMVNTDCPENQYCTSNHTCAPCGPDVSGRGSNYTNSTREKTETTCGCPSGFNIYCGSKTATSSCKEGNYICVNGCQQTSDCPVNEYCYKSPDTAEFGTCTPCPENTFRTASQTECSGCLGCEKINETRDGCVSSCSDDQVCLMKSCSASSSRGTCQISDTANTWACTAKPNLIEIRGATKGGKFFLPPAEDKYRFYQPDAARFCESYGMRLPTIQEACGKDFTYDSGHDCANISSLGLSQYHVTGQGSWWMDARYGAKCSGLTITYSCGNNHEHNVCSERFYPICYGGDAAGRCVKDSNCGDNKYCDNGNCKPCPDTYIREGDEDACHCPQGTIEHENTCIACMTNTDCAEDTYCTENAEHKKICQACPEHLIRRKDETGACMCPAPYYTNPANNKCYEDGSFVHEANFD